MIDQKTSLLINRQVPEFVREEHPNFIAFLEAYYEFLENKQGTQKNDLITEAKKLRNVSDVDLSIGQFEDNFFNTFASLIPRNVEVDKGTLLKHVLPLYLAKGSEKSFKLLFRLLFNEEVEVIQPKTSVLRASDGKWLIENAFRIEQLVYSLYTGNSTTKTFKLAQVVESTNISVYINDVLQTSGFIIRKETRKLIFNTAPSTGATIKVSYNEFDFSLLTNRQITGETSGATAVIERVSQKTINSVPIFELYINTKTLLGTFDNGENAFVNIIDPIDNTLIQIEIHGLSILRTINIITGGASYNVGDPVLISGGDATRDATAAVEEVFSGFINQIRILAGGAGFKTGSNVFVIGAGAGSLNMAIDAVDVSGANTANTFVVNTDRISDFASINISDPDYGFNASIVTENVTSKIVDALTFQTITSIGAITNVAILFANATFATVPTLDAESAPYQSNSTTQHVYSSQSVGRIQINSGGTSYQIGDEVVIGETHAMALGIGAAAAVTNVSSTGAITQVKIQPSRIRGTANTFSNTNVTVIGTNTVFQDDLRVGDYIIINNESRYINTISSNTSLNVNVNFQYSTTDRNIGKYYDYPIGGQNYNPAKPATITVSSKTGSSANLSVIALMGDGENLNATADKNLGEILKIRIIDAGSGYVYPPEINLTQSGSGTATANAIVESSYVTLPGRWTTSDSKLSSSERVIQGREYYVDYAYVLSSKVEFDKFKDTFKSLVHPAGFIEYAEFRIDNTIDANTLNTATITLDKTISGTVNVNNSIYITGINTKFLSAQSLDIISVGTSVAVNTEIRYISSIINNTALTVTSAFSQTANLQEMVILSTPLQPFIIFTELVPFTTEVGELITL